MQNAMSQMAGPAFRPLPSTGRRSTLASPTTRRTQTDRIVVHSIAPPPSPGMRSRDQLKKCSEKEASRMFRQTVFDFEYWANHRSSDRYLFNILTLPKSRIIRSLAKPVGWALGTALFVGLNCTLVESGTLPLWAKVPLTSLTPINLTSFALSLLLVFRTNSSYGRFDEARKMWGLMLNRSRDLVRQAVTFYPADDLAGKANLARWTMAFSLSLKVHLQPAYELEDRMSEVLSEKEIQLLIQSGHKPNAVLQVLSELIDKADMSQFQKMQMHANLTTFEDVLGGCERLLRTPIPLSYTRHTSRFLLIWLTALPFCMWTTMGWGTVPATVLISMLLLGIEEIGVEIEEPFGILPLVAIATRAQQDCTELINRQHVVKASIIDYDDAEMMAGQMFNIAPAPQLNGAREHSNN